MATITFSVRMEESKKRELDALCQNFGMTTSAAINLFATAVLRERKIPFEIKESEENKEELARKQAAEFGKAFYALREEAQRNGLPEMTMEEIDEEIRKARYGED